MVQTPSLPETIKSLRDTASQLNAMADNLEIMYTMAIKPWETWIKMFKPKE